MHRQRARSEVHKAGRAIFAQQDFVYRLDTTMRFSDETLIGILQKMRTPGGCNLTENEWRQLCNTNLVMAPTEATPVLQSTKSRGRGQGRWGERGGDVQDREQRGDSLGLVRHRS